VLQTARILIVRRLRREEEADVLWYATGIWRRLPDRHPYIRIGAHEPSERSEDLVTLTPRQARRARRRLKVAVDALYPRVDPSHSR
jgi:hypothetical protein